MCGLGGSDVSGDFVQDSRPETEDCRLEVSLPNIRSPLPPSFSAAFTLSPLSRTAAVQSVSFPKDTSDHLDSDYSLCFERGGKVAKTSEYKCSESSAGDGRYVVDFDESITISATMYQTPQGDYLVPLPH